MVTCPRGCCRTCPIPSTCQSPPELTWHAAAHSCRSADQHWRRCRLLCARRQLCLETCCLETGSTAQCWRLRLLQLGGQRDHRPVCQYPPWRSPKSLPPPVSAARLRVLHTGVQARRNQLHFWINEWLAWFRGAGHFRRTHHFHHKALWPMTAMLWDKVAMMMMRAPRNPHCPAGSLSAKLDQMISYHIVIAIIIGGHLPRPVENPMSLNSAHSCSPTPTHTEASPGGWGPRRRPGWHQ